MLPTRFDPFNDIKALEKQFYPSFRAFFDENRESNHFLPSVNAREGEDSYHIELDLPGVKKEDIKVDLTDNILTISGERKMKEEVKEDSYYKFESRFGSFQRSFTLPKGVDTENLRASAEDGVLEVVIPKAEERLSRQIEVQ